MDEESKEIQLVLRAVYLGAGGTDDVLCLLAGLTKMKFSTYFWIIILCKPWTIAAYSFGLQYGARWLLKLMGN